MYNFLYKIYYKKNIFITNKKKIYTLKQLKYKVKPSLKKNFYYIIRPYHDRINWILEYKNKSPLKGVLNKKINLIRIAKIYNKYASVISVITDKKYFNGSLIFLNQLSNLVKIPVLCKEFILKPFQVYLARLYKADSILLILSLLNDLEYLKLVNIAHHLRMGVLTEINNEYELNRAILLKAKIIGINNRNLCNLLIDLNKIKIITKKIFNEISIISESGINNILQIKEINKFVNGFLIGSSLMSEIDLDIAIRKIIIGENKVCGINKLLDAKIVKRVGALYIGLNFIKNSIRYINELISIKLVRNIIIYYVGIFRNLPITYLISLVLLLKLFAIQLHGKENNIYILNIIYLLNKKCNIWKVIEKIDKVIEYNSNKISKYINKYVLDNNMGGIGKTLNWFKLKNVKGKNIILAGGLKIYNIAVSYKLNIIGLDLNSGIEKSPGVKNYKKLARIFNILRK